jgi:hypothetical protein
LSARRIYQDLVEQNGFNDSYQSVQRFVRKLKATQPQRVRRMEARPGEEVQVDFGLGAPIYDGAGRARRSWVFRMVHLSPVRGVVLGQGTPMERRKGLREYRWSSYRGYAGLEKMKSFLDSEPIQGVFESYSGRCWKAWAYRRSVEEGLIGEIADPFEAVKMAADIGWGGIFAQTQRSMESKSRATQELWTEEKLVSWPTTFKLWRS